MAARIRLIFLMTPTTLTTGWYLKDASISSRQAKREHIVNSPFLVGRSSECDFQISSINVSRRHVEFIIAGELAFLQDLNSRNGTYVNGYRTHGLTPIGVGDVIQFGDTKFEVGRVCVQPPCISRTIELMPCDTLLAQVTEILEDNQFHMVYQPIVSADQHEMYGVEALLRCDIPGFESPMRLFQSAVRLGLEEQLSNGCRTKAVEGVAPYSASQRLFLNTHPNEFLGGNLLESLKELTGLAGQWTMVVEVHESAVPNMKTMERFQAAVHDLNIELAYDDFGAGQRRLQEISEIRPDYVKFDRGLVHGIVGKNLRQQELLKSLVHHCRDRGIKTIAEGLDNQADGEFCQEIGFDLFQGYFYGKPADTTKLFIKN